MSLLRRLFLATAPPGLILPLLAAAGCGGPRGPGSPADTAAVAPSGVFDHHVHVLSPALVERWKSLGVTFSKPDYAYSDIDSIRKFNPAGGMFLVSMAYLWSSEGFADSAEQRRVEEENDFTISLARRRPGELYAFCAVNPLRDHAAGEVLRARAAGAYGLKLHFAVSGVDLAEPSHLMKIRGLFTLASRERMPVLLHFHNQAESFGEREIRPLIDSVLAAAPPIELFLAHLGTSGGYTHLTREVASTLAAAHRNRPVIARHTVWFDLSAVALTEPAEGAAALTPDDFAELAGLLREIGLDRVVFGTDYPVFNTRAALAALDSELALAPGELARIAGNARPAEDGSAPPPADPD